MKDKSAIWRCVSVFTVLVLWQVLSVSFGIDYIFASPLQTVQRLLINIAQSEFWEAVLYSFVRITCGFLISFILGILFAIIAAKYRVAENILWPLMITIKSVPVASFVVLALIVFSSQQLSMLTSAIISLPIIYNNVLTAIKSVDKKMLEMAIVFDIRGTKITKYIWFPAIKPYLVSACRTSIGMAWKAGIAAEIIGIPKGSVGFEMYVAKVNLDSANLLAWTAVILLISVLFEKMFTMMLKLVFDLNERK